jgi:hypothetical protein
MRYRVAFALAFVAVVGGLIALRDHGFLGGREAGGPFRIRTAAIALEMQRDAIAAFTLSGRLEGDAVRVQNVRPRLASPEVEVLGPNLYAGHLGAARPKRWPPRGAGAALEDARVDDARVGAIMGLRAQRAGLYYVLGLVVDYRRGQRRFRDREPQSLCISVHTKQRCDLDYGGPGDARVAQVGGPSRYPGSELSETEAAYTEAGEYRLRITIANQTRSAIDVSAIALDDNAFGVELTASAPDEFHLPPKGYRVVRLRARLPRCMPSSITFSRLRAKLDSERRSIPLSLPLRFGCG